MAVKTEFAVVQTASREELQTVPTSIMAKMTQVIVATYDVKIGYGTHAPTEGTLDNIISTSTSHSFY